jgi:hypothetical protein
LPSSPSRTKLAANTGAFPPQTLICHRHPCRLQRCYSRSSASDGAARNGARSERATKNGRPELILTVDSSNESGDLSASSLAARAKVSAHQVKARTARSKDTLEEEAWDLLQASIVEYCGNCVGTIAANDPTVSNALNYDQVFIRDFIPSAMAFLLRGEHEIVRNFLLHTLQLQVWILDASSLYGPSNVSILFLAT